MKVDFPDELISYLAMQGVDASSIVRMGISPDAQQVVFVDEVGHHGFVPAAYLGFSGDLISEDGVERVENASARELLDGRGSE